MEARSFHIPYVIAALIVPAAMTAIMPVYFLTLASAGGGGVDLLRSMAVTETIFAVFATGVAVWLLLRQRVTHDAALNLAAAAFAAGVTVTLFSFGHRTAGEFTLVASIGGLVVSLPDDLRSGGIVLRPPTRGTLIYLVVTLELPAFLVLGLATRDCVAGNNSAAADFGTAWFLYLTYLFGYMGWSAIRSHFDAWAFAGACFCAVWGFPMMMLVASLGPISLIVPVAGVGGVAACLPHLSDQLNDDAAAVTPRRAAR